MNNWLVCMDVCGFYLFDCKKKVYKNENNREEKKQKYSMFKYYTICSILYIKDYKSTI